MSGPDAAIPAENGSRRRGLVLVLVVFVLGLVCGAALTIIGIRSVGPRPFATPPDGPPRGEMRRGFERMSVELGLTEDQQREIRAIFERSREEIHEITRESGDAIRELLTEEQRAKFDEMRRHRRPMGGRRGPGHRGREEPPPPDDMEPPPQEPPGP
jgi:Spy/CpxP family protein refolding chaperone